MSADATLGQFMRYATVGLASNLVLYLASDEATYSTGSEFVVDGGILSAH